MDISGSAINYLTKTPLQIGEEPGYPGRFFHGLIDEVRVWNYARTSEELQSTMNEILNGDETGLVGYWRFDQTFSNQFKDHSGNNNSGILMNMDSNQMFALSDFNSSFTIDEDTVLTLTAGYDIDGDTYTMTTIVGPSNGVIALDAAMNILSYTPDSDYSGTDMFVYGLNDGLESNSYTISVDVTFTNDLPVISSISDQTMSEDGSIDVYFTASDIETSACGMAITLSSSDQAIIADGNLTYVCDSDNYTITATPLSDQNGTVSISVSVGDSNGGTAVTTFDLTVTAANDAPTLSIYSRSDNLLVNPGAETGDTSGWTVTANGGSGWSTRGGSYAHSGSYAFISSHQWCRKNQLIDLLAEGFSETLLDSEPDIYIQEWARDRQSSDSYQLKVELRDASQLLMDSYDTGVVTVSDWVQYSHTFQSYGTGLRYVYFEHAGDDSEEWSGQYGAIMDDAVVMLDIDFTDTFDEDTVLSSLITLSDVDGDSLTLSVISSSDTGLIPVENITFSGTGLSRAITITPTSNASGNVTVTIAVSDGNLTSTTEQALTVTTINDYPSIGSISDQTTIEDIATNVISFTATDTETSTCNMTLSMRSSDQILVPDEYLLSMCSGNEYSIVATPAMDQYGIATISVTITDAGGATASTSFNLTVTDVDDSQYIWANFQAAESVLGQSDFASISSGTTAILMNDPSNAAVDPTTGKVFVCDGLNHRILRFSGADALLNGASAEAVLGQTDFISGTANRGGSAAANTLHTPGTVFVDTFGRLWVGDQTNHRVLRFDNASEKANGADADGVLGQPNFTTNSAGTEQNKMNRANGVWVDAAGTLWVAEWANHRVLRFDHAAEKSNGANADGILGNSIYTTSSPGSTQDKFSYPVAVSVDNHGTLYVSDSGNNRVLRFDNAASKSNGANADGVLGQPNFTATDANTSVDGLSGPRSTAVDHAGHLYIADSSNSRVVIHINVSNKTDGAAADYVLGQPDFTSNTQNYGGISARSLKIMHYIFFDNQTNNLWVPDYSNDRVLRYRMMTKTPPEMSIINDATMDEDTISTSVSFTVTDINEQALTITYQSSDTSLISVTGITFTGNEISTDGTAYTVSATAVASTVTLIITPEANQSGNCSITITVTDPDGMTAVQSFALEVISVNDVPQVSTINPQSMDEGTSIALSLTATDVEGDSLSVTASSADQGLIQDSDIVLSNDGSTYTITITPMTAQAGITDITISVDDGTDITHMTFSITVNEVYYMIAGHVSSYTDIAGSDLEGVTLTLSGTHSYSMLTNANGYYTFTTVRPGDYTLTASRSGEINLEIGDAVQILKAVVRKVSLTCLVQIAADVYNDGYVGAYDAARVLDYLAGFENCVNDSCTFWQFATENITSCETFPLIEFENARRYTDLTGDVVGQDFIGIGAGKVLE